MTTPTNPLRTEARAKEALENEGIHPFLDTDGLLKAWVEYRAYAPDLITLADQEVPGWDAPPERPLPVPMTKEEIAAAVELPRSVATYAIWPTGTVFIGSMYRHEDKPPRGAVFFDASTTTPEQVYRYALAHIDDNGRFVPPKGE